MNWLHEILCQPSVIQTVIVISAVSALGVYLGKIKFFGISLGITFVFFSGILASHFGVKVNKDMLAFAQNFGLIIFIYTLGLQVGPGFFSSFKKGGIKLNMLSLGVVFIGTLMALILTWITPIPLSDMMGLLSGAVTNTPMLGAAQQALLQVEPDNAKGVTDMALACAVTYPLGVIGVILSVIILRAMSGKKTPRHHEDDNSSKTYVAEFLVSNPAIFGKSIKEAMHMTDRHFVISRVWRNGKVCIPTSETRLEKGDQLLVVSTQADVENATALFGEQENADWNKEGIDWNAIDSQLISRRILVTRNKINGVKLGSLRLRNLYGINITRVNRAGIDLIASPNLHLQVGDKLTIVGEANSINNVGKILGDEAKRLNKPNLLAIFIGLAVGVFIGAIPFSIPGMSTPVKLGIAGGPIIIGILMGAFGSRLHLTTYTTESANLMMREFGLVVYLAGLGLDSGEHFFETVFRTEGLIWLAIGLFLAVVPVLIVGWAASRFFNVDYAHNVGMLCGSMANPMALNYANTTVTGDEPSVSYATVYPLSIFVRVITAQLILLFF
ncbi:MAG: putative transporter [Bacteroidetes bacterium]|uniref:Transporter n=1 Tax=Candidatus Cryptobacteroides intestinigallinarum TaxID=2840767 RepID=A0A9D9HJJ4_9BACT|nr:putative transporter [Candidatus Cryptobacteroides intestinigallinarum]